MSLAPHYILLGPILSEESQIQTTKANQYTFKVVPSANKNQIRDAIQTVYNVTIIRVNTMNYDGKKKRQATSRRVGKAKNWKKAIVTLKQGQTIDLI